MPTDEEFAEANQIADWACDVDDVKVNIRNGSELVDFLHNQAQSMAGDRVDEIYSQDEE